MKHKLTKAAASATIAGALLLAAPAVAQAYVPTSPDTVTVTVTANGPVPIDGFTPGASVTFTLVGRGVTGANIATANLPVTSASVIKTADSSGVATAVVTLPANPSGSYTVSATGPRASAGGGSGVNAGGAGGTALPATGVDSQSMMGIWIGGGALLAAGATVAVAAKVRRNRAETNS
ncbi:LPXTG cell wall anchor domain-containing protein [Microbacterium testaceum]|uniref:LPXTG cell wall anchor domain-containing protein n=1 Tax=Microbacterium testaceum TaxID=2033 RepID=UPI001D17261D|nr:LPXTG cell wall anchor domain-containing protein [Microbacterium testaceum]MCC4249443.1 LPXTG cell wall anchor domain-containing protein [Microbacterium testaceum]